MARFGFLSFFFVRQRLPILLYRYQVKVLMLVWTQLGKADWNDLQSDRFPNWDCWQRRSYTILAKKGTVRNLDMKCGRCGSALMFHGIGCRRNWRNCEKLIQSDFSFNSRLPYLYVAKIDSFQIILMQMIMESKLSWQ